MNRRLLFWTVVVWAISAFCIMILGISTDIRGDKASNNEEVAVVYNLDFVKMTDYDISVLLDVEEIEEPEPYYEVTDYERELLERLVYHEGNTESLECQKAISSVVFNRLYDEYDRFRAILEEDIYAPCPFSVASYLFTDEPTATI